MEKLLALFLQVVGGADPPSELEKAGYNPVEYLQTLVEQNVLFAALLGFIFLDIISGVFAAGQEKKLSSQVSWVGMLQKAQTIVYIGAAQLLQWVMLKALHQDFPIAGSIQIFFIFREMLSITENAKRGGIKIPAWIGDKLEDLTERAERGEIVVTASPLKREVTMTVPAPKLDGTPVITEEVHGDEGR
jgi:toxin secretion/phage lysis holin